MADGLTNSRLLQKILDCAAEFKKTSGCEVLTLNHIMLALIKFVNGGLGSTDGLDIDEVNAVKKILSETFDFSNDTTKLSTANASIMEDLQCRQVLVSASTKSKKAGKNHIGTDVLLNCMIGEPTPEIKALMKGVGSSDRFSAPTSTPASTPAAKPLTDASPSGSADTFSKGQQGSASGGTPFGVQQKAPAPAVEVTPENAKVFIKELTAKVKNMQNRLREVVFGQDNAVSVFASGYFQAEMRAITDKNNKKPRATFLFAGPPGVGKTFLAEQIASEDVLNLPFKRFDMSEYAESGAAFELCGTDPSYKAAKSGALTGYVAENPRCILLFDEVEKSHIDVIYLFLQVLDAGTLGDAFTGKKVDFSQTILIFTTNAGRKLYDGAETANLASLSRKTILNALEKDVDPASGKSVFPAAICSRFATGNVVMFNHMEAHSLRKIAVNTIKKSVSGFENETGIKCNIYNDVYSCILFSEGGHADARTVTSRSKAFFTTELYELFRLVSDRENEYSIDNIQEINIDINLPQTEEIVRLFRDTTKGCVVTLADDVISDELTRIIESTGYKNIVAKSAEEAIGIVSKQNVEFVLCDLYYKRTNENAASLNIEDIGSEGRSFFKYVCEKTDVPLYIVCNNEHVYRAEERFSLIKEGARDIIDVSTVEDLGVVISDILVRIHQQQSMIDLARSNKIVTYDTLQQISDDGKIVNVTLFDLKLNNSVDADDQSSILSSLSKPDVTFDDIIGAEKTKEELLYFINYLKNPKVFAAKGMGAPKGILFYGPPGTGKTMIAKALAGESNVTFMAAEGNQFLKKYVGEGEESVHRLFMTARKYAPAIIFIDEIDAIAKERNGEHPTASSILTAFLSEMDGFKSDVSKPVFVLAATNFNVEPGTSKSLDPALVRRFDRHIFVDLPDKSARIKYLQMQVSKNSFLNLSDAEIENIAVRSTGMSLANLASVFEFAKRIAIRTDKDTVDDKIFEEAFETFNYGEEKKWDPAELKKTAYHEAGHAFLCWQSGETPSYLTIVARGNHGGYMQHGDNENRGSYTKQMLLDRIRTSLGGRAAEIVFFGEKEGLTTGASSDLSHATAVAKAIICRYGMDSSTGLAVIDEKDFTNGAVAQGIMDKVNELLNQEMEKAVNLLAENRVAIDKIVEVLMERDHLGKEEINAVFSQYATKNA